MKFSVVLKACSWFGFLVQGYLRILKLPRDFLISVYCDGYSTKCLCLEQSAGKLGNSSWPSYSFCFLFSEFIIGHSLFVLVLHVGLFVFAFSSKSQWCLIYPRTLRILTQTCVRFAYKVNEPSSTSSWSCSWSRNSSSSGSLRGFRVQRLHKPTEHHESQPINSGVR